MTEQAGGPVLVEFDEVDGSPFTASMLRTMDVTDTWSSVRALRAWTRPALGAADAVLDAGCGLGTELVELALAHAAVDGDDGRFVGLDTSDAMLTEAARRARAAGAAVELHAGDVTALPFDDDTFDAARAERLLQWLADPAVAVAELARVVRPGGAVVLVDTDWRTLVFNHPDHALVRRVVAAMVDARPSSVVGGYLADLALDAGLVDVEVRAEVQLCRGWGPEFGMLPPETIVAGLVASGAATEAEVVAFVDESNARMAAGRFVSTLTLGAVVGRVPS